LAITYFGSASTPADDAANALATTPVTPPASMLAGDLVVLFAVSRSTTTAEMSELGGQTWTSETINPTYTSRIFWCRFNGTWSADPSVLFGAAVCNSVVMHVFRPTTGTNTWAIDVAQVNGSYTAPTTPFTVTITGITTITDGALVFAAWQSRDENTWDSLTAGWTVSGGAQYRNTASSNQSLTNAHLVKTTAGATGDVSKNQATLGGDSGSTHIIAWKEVVAGVAANAIFFGCNM